MVLVWESDEKSSPFLCKFPYELWKFSKFISNAGESSLSKKKFSLRQYTTRAKVGRCPWVSQAPNAVNFTYSSVPLHRYLALGERQKNVCDSYRISKQYFGKIVAVVCKAIAQELHWEIPQWEKYAILGSARDFEKRWNLPNCAGAIGGKLVKVKVPFCRQVSTKFVL